MDVDGKVLETSADNDGGAEYISEIEILRGDLSRVLHDDTRDGVEYIFGDRIAGLTQDADGVDVTFAGGARRRFDLVVEADGLHSALRTMVFGPHERFVRHLGHVMACLHGAERVRGLGIPLRSTRHSHPGIRVRCVSAPMPCLPPRQCRIFHGTAILAR